MRVLLDTHAFLWFVRNDQQLSAAAKTLVENPNNTILISPVSFWEIAIKISIGKYWLTRSYEDFWKRGMYDNDIEILPIEVRHTTQMLNMPFHHKDSFDRLLVAQTLAEDIPLVSNDTRLDAYGVRRMW